MKVERSTIFRFLFITALMAVQYFIFSPRIQKLYLSHDVRYFESWPYSLGIGVVVFVLVVYKHARSKENFDWKFVMLLLAYITFMMCIFNSLVKDFLLYLNTKVAVESTNEQFVVVKAEGSDFVSLYKGDEGITFPDEVQKIDLQQQQHRETSVYKLKNKDTVTVVFQKGFLNVRFLELKE